MNNETSPFLDPRVVVPLVLAAISLIVWFVRLENKNSANSEAIKRLEKENSELKEKFENHRLNQNAHYNEKAEIQANQENNRRFSSLETQLKEINQKLDKLAEKR